MLSLYRFTTILVFFVISCVKLSFQFPAKPMTIDVPTFPQQSTPSTLNLTLLHVNDIHSHFDEINSYTGRCHEDQAKNGECFGGAGRMVTKVNEIRGRDPKKTLLLNAGDYYQGTIYYTLFKYDVVTEFANLLNYDAFGVGNHDFDDGPDGLIPFVNDINFPVLAANLDTSKVPELKISKSITLDVDGHKVGIIGYVTADTPFISSPGPNLTFLDVIPAVQEEAIRLTSENVSIIIALGHAGYEIDREMASKIKELDLVVGGHSHTFLWTGEDYPSVEYPLGNYPTYVKVEGSDKIVPVVQAYAYGKYLGHLELCFDENGDLMNPVDGTGVQKAIPVILNSNITQDEAALNISQKYRKNMTEYTKTIGYNRVLLKLEGYDDSNIGNIVTDCMVEAWNGEADMGFINNGGIRSNLVEGNITGEDIFNVLPFNNTVDRVEMTGKDIRSRIEEVIKDLCPDKSCYSSFWQVSNGVRLVYRIQNENQGNRIEKFQVRCTMGGDAWCDVEDEKTYKVVMPNFLATSKYFSVHSAVKKHEVGISDYDAFSQYVERKKIIDEEDNGFGRIVVYWDTSDEPNTGTMLTSNFGHISALFLLAICKMIMQRNISK